MANDTNRFFLHPDVPVNAWRVFGKWYPTTGAERANNPILGGDFQTDEEWWNDWFAEEEEEEEDDEEEE